MKKQMTWWQKNKWLVILGTITGVGINVICLCAWNPNPFTERLAMILAVPTAIGFLLLIIASGGIGLDHTDLIED